MVYNNGLQALWSRVHIWTIGDVAIGGVTTLAIELDVDSMSAENSELRIIIQRVILRLHVTVRLEMGLMQPILKKHVMLKLGSTMLRLMICSRSYLS
uniref:Uncharacterized protein n=1 Tax=uncultured Thiotrichaceae bacterium TaxID=298394 RepID=A0A6S6SAL1_9GAMM|nr:MAG: Unknown protein [uncultured Thiotrichaceae bacterium]